jgi:hypothetical protein
MKMDKLRFLTLALAVCLLVGCGQYEQAFQTAVVQTQAAGTLTVGAPIPSAPAFTPQSVPSSTPRPILLPETPLPKITYSLETGFCPKDVGQVDAAVDPKTLPFCRRTEQQQVALSAGQEVTVTQDPLASAERYCALFTLEGKFIMSDMDTTGSGKVTCHP